MGERERDEEEVKEQATLERSIPTKERKGNEGTKRT